MDKSWEKFVSPRKRMAMGDKDPLNVGNFDVAALSSHAAGGPSGQMTDGGPLKDDMRAAAPPIKGNQANPDHGYRYKG